MKEKHKLAANVPEQKEPPKPQIDVKKIAEDYLSLSLKQKKAQDRLLGEFDADGKYSLTNEKTLQALVELPKMFDSQDDNVIYAYSRLGENVLNFKITLDLAESYCTAKIEFVETQRRSVETVKHLTELDSFIEPYSPLFTENACARWKVSLKEEPLFKDDYLLGQYSAMKKQTQFNAELVEVLSQLFVMRLLKELENQGDLGKEILKNYQTLVAKLRLKDPAIMQDYTLLKRILEEQIENSKAFKKLLQVEAIARIYFGYTAPLNRLNGKNVPTIEPTQQKKEEKKEEKKDDKKAASAAPAKKKAKAKAKAKGGGGIKIDITKLGSLKPSPSAPPKAPEKKEEKKETPKEEKKQTQKNKKEDPYEKYRKLIESFDEDEINLEKELNKLGVDKTIVKKDELLIDENRENLTKIVVEEKQIVQVKQVEIGETLNQEDSLLINKSRENLTKVGLGAKQQINEEKLLVKNERTDGREI